VWVTLVCGDERFGKRNECVATATVHGYGTTVSTLIDMIGAGILTGFLLRYLAAKSRLSSLKM
jgi:hypothetical protein